MKNERPLSDLRAGLVSVATLNALRFRYDPQPPAKLWRWCREGKLPARKVGGEWFVDLDAFDRGEKGSPKQRRTSVTHAALDRLRAT